MQRKKNRSSIKKADVKSSEANYNRLQERNAQLEFAMETAELATWDLNLITNKITGNDLYYDWFGLSDAQETEISNIFNGIAEQDFERVVEAYTHALDYTSGGKYEIEYTIMPKQKPARILRVKGKAWFNEQHLAYRFTGIMQDISQQTDLLYTTIDEVEHTFRSVIEEIPVPTVLVKGEDMIIATLNEPMIRIMGKGHTTTGKPLREAVPELKSQVYLNLLDNVYATGKPYVAEASEAKVVVNGKLGTYYFNINLKPLTNKSNQVYGILATVIDVTDKVLSQKQLEKSEAYFRNMVQQAPVAMALTRGKDNIFESINKPMLEMINRTEDVIGKKLLDVLFDVDLTNVIDEIRQVYETGKPFRGLEVPVKGVGKNKGMGYFNISYTPIFYLGKINGVLHIASEVTEQVLFRKKIEDEEERTRLALDAGEFGVFEIDLKSDEIITDHRFKEIMNVDQSMSEYSDLYPFELQIKAKAIEEGLKSGSFDFETRILHKDYKKIWVRSKGKLYFNDSKLPIKIHGVIQDVTERKYTEDAMKESEERFRIMADAAPNLFWSLNPDASLKYINKFALNLLGVSLEDFINKSWAPFIHPDDLEATQKKTFEAIQNKQSYSLEVRILRKDGEYRWLYSQSVPSYYSNGELYGYVGSAIDITDLKQANTQLIQINNDLDSFIYTASHDLKAPMLNIEGLLYSLKDKLKTDLVEMDEDTKLLLEFMQTSIERFKNTILDLTEIVKVQKIQEEDIRDVNLSQLLDDVKTSISNKIIDSGITIETDFSKVNEIKFSKKNLKSIVYNLLSNAIKYRDESRPSKVFISTVLTAKHIVLIVKDNGLGISKNHQKQLFTMFKRFHGHVEGSGIGLYIINRIMENAGGKIEVESEEGKGTTFKVNFKR